MQFIKTWHVSKYWAHVTKMLCASVRLLCRKRDTTLYSWKRKESALPENHLFQKAWLLQKTSKPDMLPHRKYTFWGVFGFFFYTPAVIKLIHSLKKVLSTSYTEMTDNLTDSEQGKVLKVLSGRSKKFSSRSKGTDQHTACSFLQAIHMFSSSFVPHY